MSMRGASAESAGALREELAAAAGRGEVTATVADELFAVAGTVRSEAALRRFVTDAAVPSQARAGLVAQVFGGRLDDVTQALLTSAVSRRWIAARDLADALDDLSVVARVTSTGSEAERLSDELFAVGRAVKDAPELRDALSDPARTAADKGGLVDSILAGRALPATVALVKQALAGEARTVSVALEAYQRLAAQTHGQGVATVRSAHPLSTEEQQRLAAALHRQYGRPVHLNLVVDPAVIGGLRVEIGDDVIDGTVSARLADAQRRLAG